MPSLIPISALRLCGFRPADRRPVLRRLGSGAWLLIAAALLAGPFANPAWAATRAATLLVSMNVEPGCPVSSVASQTANGWASNAPVNCASPAGYQVQTGSGSPTEPAGLASTGTAAAGGFRYASSAAGNTLAAQGNRAPGANDSDHGLAALLPSGEATDPAAVVVTIVY